MDYDYDRILEIAKKLELNKEEIDTLKHQVILFNNMFKNIFNSLTTDSDGYRRYSDEAKRIQKLIRQAKFNENVRVALRNYFPQML